MDQPRERAGRRWQDDPDIKAAVERLLLRVGRDVHALRERHGWSQETEAEAAGLHPDTIQALERSQGDPRLSTLVRLFYVHGYELQIGLRPTTQPAIASPVVTG